jgi:hypothetical protein
MVTATVGQVLVGPVDIVLGIPNRGVPALEQDLFGGELWIA